VFRGVGSGLRDGWLKAAWYLAFVLVIWHWVIWGLAFAAQTATTQAFSANQWWILSLVTFCIDAVLFFFLLFRWLAPKSVDDTRIIEFNRKAWVYALVCTIFTLCFWVYWQQLVAAFKNEPCDSLVPIFKDWSEAVPCSGGGPTVNARDQPAFQAAFTLFYVAMGVEVVAWPLVFFLLWWPAALHAMNMDDASF